MLDVLFIAAVVAFFAVTGLYVRGCARIVAHSGGRAMTVGDCLLILLVVALLVYLVYALLAPERLG